MSPIRDRRPGIAEWRAASLDDYRDALTILGLRQTRLSAAVVSYSDPHP